MLNRVCALSCCFWMVFDQFSNSQRTEESSAQVYGLLGRWRVVVSGNLENSVLVLRSSHPPRPATNQVTKGSAKPQPVQRSWVVSVSRAPSVHRTGASSCVSFSTTTPRQKTSCAEVEGVRVCGIVYAYFHAVFAWFSIDFLTLSAQRKRARKSMDYRNLARSGE